MESGQELSPVQGLEYQELISQRASGVPIPYLTGVKEFYGRAFMVDEHVLIPRPETELLVDAAKAVAARRQPSGMTAVDIGTGSGCIACTLALELSPALMLATDISPEALNVARKNASRLRADVEFYHGDLFDALPRSYRGGIDLICCNPPYLSRSDIDTTDSMQLGLQYEPDQALYPNGYDFSVIARVIRESAVWCTPAGTILIEIGHAQGADARMTAQQYFPNSTIEIRKDLAGNDRLLVVQASE